MGEVTLLALGVMISPSSITLVILLILQRRGIASPVVFVAGRVLAAFLILFTVLIFFRNVDFSPETTSSVASAAAKVAIGVLLLLLGLGLVFSKSTGEEAGWLQRRIDSVERLSPLASGGLGFAFVLLSPRCFFLILAAAATILHANVSVPDGITALAVFVIIADLGVLAPIIIYIASPQRSASLLDSVRKWIIRYQRVLILTVLMVFGTYLVIRGTLDLLL
jgi:hypothetical protein